MTTVKSTRLIFKARESEPRFTNATNGTTHIVAITAKGPITDDEVYSNIDRFKEVYGSETVPNGTLSNIERAIELGSAVRIFKVEANTVAGWTAAITRSRDFDDAYQLFCSHLYQHISTVASVASIHKFAADLVSGTLKDRVYFIELETSTPATYLTSLSISRSEYIALFYEKIGYYKDDTIVYCDCLGTVAGLADRAMDRYGAWKTFSGIVRGIVAEGQALQYSPILTEASIISNRLNTFRLKTNRDFGFYTKPTLWNNFSYTTYNATDDTNPLTYLNNVRLIIYMKKVLGIILSSYLEEPNTFSTWATIASDAEGFLQILLSDQAIAGYTWEGDQRASSYEELQINSEEGVRQGVYKIQLSITEQVLLRELQFELILDNQNGVIIIN